MITSIMIRGIEMKSIITRMIIGWIAGLAAFVLCFVWYDWKLALILFLICFSRNVSHKVCKALAKENK